MVTFSAEIKTTASPARIWAVMTNLSLEPTWMQAVSAVSFLNGETAYRVGAQMQREGGFLGMTLRWTSEITGYEQERLIAFKHEGAIKGTSQWEIIPEQNGAVIRFTTDGPAPGPLKWLPALAAAGGRAGLKGDVKRLKVLAETAA